MMKRILIAGWFASVASLALGDIAAGTQLIYHGPLTDGTEVYSYDLKVTITGADAWTVAGGPAVGQPWITLSGGTFYQNPINDSNPPDPLYFPFVPDSQWTSFYTTPLGVNPGFTFGPDDRPTELIADWFLMPDGNDYPGYFTIARFTIIPESPHWTATVDMQIGGRADGVISFTQTLPEPSGLSLLALAGAAWRRRR